MARFEAGTWGYRLTHSVSNSWQVPKSVKDSLAPLGVGALVAYFLLLIGAVAARAAEAPTALSTLRDGIEFVLRQ